MKNLCIIFLTLIIISVMAVATLGTSTAQRTDNDYLRIHIRADSNDGCDQAVKYRVRDEVVDYLTPVVASCESKAQAMQAVAERLPEIERVADGVLQKEGFGYTAKASLTVESFPTRVYGEYVLESGEYTALILRLGRGEGENWWCVVYPPLCFTGENINVVYKSKIKELIDRFYEKRRG